MLLSIVRSASFISSPNSKVAKMTEFDSDDVDWIVRIPTIDLIDSYRGTVISRSIVSGLESG